MEATDDATESGLRLYSIVIPARDEEQSIVSTVEHIHVELRIQRVPHEIVIVDDGSTDATWERLLELQEKIPEVVPVKNEGPHGFGRAVCFGFDHMSGDAAAVMMADQSDDPRDAVRYWQKLQEGYDCVFGSRFVPGGGTVDYPPLKLVANRMANWLIRKLVRIDLNDTTNAFKAYRREVIDGCRPILAPHFNLTIELPLKAIVRGFSWTTLPITWRNRQEGTAKLLLKEMGSRYFFILMYVLLEKHFSRGDYHRDQHVEGRRDKADAETAAPKTAEVPHTPSNEIARSSDPGLDVEADGGAVSSGEVVSGEVEDVGRMRSA